MIRKIRRYFQDSKLDLREKIFRLVIVAGTFLLVCAIIESIFMEMEMSNLIAQGLLLLVMLVSNYLTFGLKKGEIAIFLVGFSMVVFTFPAIFFSCGGVNSGASVWFVLGLFYIFVMYSGKKMIAFTVFAVIWDSATYIMAYLHPQRILEIEDRKDIYFDSLFAVLAVGLSVGALLKYTVFQHGKEREIAEKQAQELEVLGKSRSQFFASMSHEIRTPINSIMGLNELILREEKLPEEVVENAVNIQNASKILLSLVNDILDVSQLENQKMELVLTEYPLKTMLGDLVDMIRVRMSEKNLNYVMNVDRTLPSVLYGDEKRVKQILINLLTNAVKYTKEGSISFTVQGELIDEERIRLTFIVSDTGIGIRKEDMEHLFESYHRGDERANSKIEGSGLGLFICRQLADLMGGQITVDSIYTKGSDFTLILEQKIVDRTPIGAVNYYLSNHEGERGHYKQSFEAALGKVLIVDDNEMNRMVVQKLLKPTKLQIDMAGSGKECLSLTREKEYQVILLDHMMPQMDGVDTLQEIRRQENGRCKDTPVIAMTANAVAGSEEIYRKYGFDGYLEKPIRGNRLEEAILPFIPEELLDYQAVRPAVHNLSGTTEQGGDHQGIPIRKKLCITTDCVCDMSQELADTNNVKMIYLYIKTEHGRFQDTKEITSGNLQQYVSGNRSRAFADSATMEEFEEFFAQRLTEAEEVIHVSMAAKAGKTYDIAKQAARGFGHVHIIDSGQISCGQALVVLYAAQLAKDGKNAVEICDALMRMKEKVRTSFVMPTSQIFYERGYTGRFVNEMCERFCLHPVLHMDQSELCVCGCLNGNLERARKRYIHILFWNKKRVNTTIVYITHVGLSVRQLQMIRSEICKYVKFEKLIIEDASVSNGCNCGIGTFGISFLRKSEW